jgi:RNA polymerase sigma factor (sigma-70 family)
MFSKRMTTAEQLESHREALVGHCYRMLGSAAEADDAVQETLVRAWRALESFDRRASLRTWLYRIATNVCLDALADRARRERPMAIGPAGTVQDPLVERPRTTQGRAGRRAGARRSMKPSIRSTVHTAEGRRVVPEPADRGCRGGPATAQ